MASISSFTRMVPIWAVKAEPERPAMMMAVISPPISRSKPDAEEVDGEDLRAEALELIGALIGQHDADQEQQQSHDGQRIDAGFFYLMNKSGDAQIPARGVNRFQPFQRHAADIAEDTVALVQDMKGGAPDTLQGCAQRMALRNLDRLHHMIGGNAFQQRRILFGNGEGRYANSGVLERQFGAHQKPASCAVEGDDFTSVDLGLGKIIRL